MARWGWLAGILVAAILAANLDAAWISLSSTLAAAWAGTRFWAESVSRTEPRRWIAWACFSYAVGDALWLISELASSSAPTPGPADLFYLAFYGLFATALIRLLRPFDREEWTQALLAALLSVAGVAAVAIRFLLVPAFGPDAQPIGAVWPSATYAAGSLLLLTLALALMYRRRTTASAGLVSSLSLMAVGDFAFLSASLADQYRAGLLTDGLWIASLLCLAFVRLDRPETLAQNASLERRMAFCLLPSLISLVTLGALVLLDLRDFGAISSGVALCTLGFVALGTGYRATEIYRQERLLRQALEVSAGELERQVADRSRDLHGLVTATRSILERLSPEEIADATLEQARLLLSADAAYLWLPPDPHDPTCESGALWRQSGLDDQELAVLNQTATLPSVDHPVVLKLRQGPQETFRLLIPVRQSGCKGWLGVARGRAYSELEQGLASSLAHSVATAMDNARTHQRVLALAERDPVTNLLNARSMHERLAALLAARGESESLGLLILDLVNFRQVNAIHGLPAGDAILRRAAQLLVLSAPEGAIIGRCGSDEFLVLLPAADLPTAAAAARMMVDTLATHGYSIPNGPFLPIPCHAGVAVAPEDGLSVNALLGAANWNLSIAKRNDVAVGLTQESRREDRKFLANESFAALDALVAAVDNKDSYTRRHSEEVADYSLWLAEELGCSTETLDLVRMAALLHDVGKIGVPTEILTKPGRLTDAEYDTMKRHPVIGGMLIGAFRGMDRILDGARYHHERWDGKGYPEGLAGNDIPWLGRLIAVADAFSAMTTNRPYRKGLSVSEALRRLEEAKGTQLDPFLVDAFLRALKRRGLYRPNPRSVPKAA
ncbi:MAG: diguanylate cyclase [Fimbriimonadales bacterium]|nr:diguanylate cyclase [Fimbriimonadales bacterium]